MRAGGGVFSAAPVHGGASHRDAVPGGGAAAGGGVAGVPRSFPAATPVAAAHGVRGAGGRAAGAGIPLQSERGQAFLIWPPISPLR